MNEITQVTLPSSAQTPNVATEARGLEPPRWSRWNEIFRVVFYPPYLKKTARIALIVGSVLFLINHLDEVVRGQATFTVWLKGAATYLVPFCVANMGVLVAARKEA
jgi:hypothetical protein